MLRHLLFGFTNLHKVEITHVMNSFTPPGNALDEGLRLKQYQIIVPKRSNETLPRTFRFSLSI